MMNKLEERHLQFALFLAAAVAVAAIFWLKNDPTHRALLAALAAIGALVGAAVALNKKTKNDDDEPHKKHSLSDDIKSLDSACQRLTEGKPPTHPLPVMLGGYFSELSREIIRDSVELSPEYYQACFSNLKKHSEAEIFAIADLSNDGENWNISQTSLWEGVRERVFHIHWKDLYSGRLELFLERSLNLDKQKIEENNCSIKLITSREADIQPWKSIFHTHRSVGKNLLLIGDELIGGYVSSSVGIQLRLEIPSSADVVKNKELYKRMADNAIAIKPFMKARDIRSKWIEKFRIGEWDPDWNNKQERGSRYVDDYDQHIYCWIPDYDEMISECFREIRDELDHRCQSKDRQIRVLELGCGTGALTKPVVEWVLGLQNVLSKRFASFKAIDQSKKMLERTEERISLAFGSEHQKFLKFSQMRFDVNLRNESGEKYDVIFGSLIFHFLIGKEWNEITIVRVINHIKNEWLAEGGCMIWADLFFSECDRDEQTKYWFDHMRLMGLTESSISVFRENNKDMTHAPSFELLKKSLISEGCALHLKIPAVSRNPFNIVKITYQNMKSRTGKKIDRKL